MFNALLTATFEGLRAVSFQREREGERVLEKCSTLWSVCSFFDISRKKKTTQILFM